jgi:hypothetical protein
MLVVPNRNKKKKTKKKLMIADSKSGHCGHCCRAVIAQSRASASIALTPASFFWARAVFPNARTEM